MRTLRRRRWPELGTRVARLAGCSGSLFDERPRGSDAVLRARLSGPPRLPHQYWETQEMRILRITFSLVALVGLSLIGGGVFLIVQRETRALQRKRP
jgi:hypothetical protein